MPALCLLQGPLNVGANGILSLSASSGRTNIAELLFVYIYIYIFIEQRFQAEQNNSSPAASPRPLGDILYEDAKNDNTVIPDH